MKINIENIRIYKVVTGPGKSYAWTPATYDDDELEIKIIGEKNEG